MTSATRDAPRRYRAGKGLVALVDFAAASHSRAVAAVLLTYWTALAFVSRRAAVLAGVMLAGSILLGVEARLAKTDAMLLLTVVAAMGALARVYLAGNRDGQAVPTGWALPAIFW